MELGGGPPPAHYRSDTGSGTVLVLAVVAVLALMAMTTILVGQLIIDRLRADTAADLAALAGANTIAKGEACTAAAHIAAENGATLESCRTQGSDVSVEVSVSLSPLAARVFRIANSGDGRVAATARAGPATE